VQWLGEQSIHNTDKVVIESLRGRVAGFDVLSGAVRRQWVSALTEHEPTVIIVDCLRPILDALGLEEHTGAGRVLIALDQFTAEIGASELIVVHHMGHNSERSRGDSRIRDWPDVEWKIVRQGDAPSSTRYFSAYGRDVDAPETRLHYDPASRHLLLANGSRADATVDAATITVLKVLSDAPGLTGRQLETALTEADIKQKPGRLAKRKAITEGYVRTEDGKGVAKLHYLTPAGEIKKLSSTTPTPRHDHLSTCATTRVGTGITHHQHADGASNASECVTTR
jgi:hypothetical protein